MRSCALREFCSVPIPLLRLSMVCGPELGFLVFVFYSIYSFYGKYYKIVVKGLRPEIMALQYVYYCPLEEKMKVPVERE